MDKNIINKTFDRETRIVYISFNTPNTSANVLNEQLFNELDELLNRAAQDKGIKGIVFASGKPKIYLAGADLVSMQENIDDVPELDKLIKKGQKIFSKIQNLPVPTVAAIHGLCLGGGLELALACTARIASNDKVTKLGVPEVMLGILPAWGGCTRLIRLLGSINALKLALTGVPVSAKYAKKIGLVDEITYKEKLLQTAGSLCIKKIKRKKPKSIFNWFVFRKAKQNIIKRTKGNYPAPLAIIDVMSRSLSVGTKKSFDLEREGFLKLSQTDECRNLIRIFFLQERVKKLKWARDTDKTQPSKATEAVVIGAGTMGAGICQWLATKGFNVLLKDISIKQISSGLKYIGDLLISGVLKFKFDRPLARDVMSRIKTTTESVSLKNKDIVIEAIAENFDLKKRVFREIEKETNRNTIIATNTSALSITELAKDLKYPGRFIGIHFFNPVHKMKLVEIVVGEKTTDRTISRTIEFVKSIGKLPVVVKDRPGFLVNRILLPYLVEACRLAACGANIEKIDRQLVQFGMPMGPFTLLDEIGIDVAIHVARDLENRLEGFKIPGALDKLLENGEYGKKTGKGFYIYGKNKKKPNTKLLKLISTTIPMSPNPVDHLIGLMVHESKMCIEEKIVDDSDIVDFSMIMGTGWAPFRGGPLQYAKQFKK